MRVFLRQDRAGGDELRGYGAVPVSVCDAGVAAAAGDASSGVEPSRVGVVGGGFFFWGSAAVFDSVLCVFVYDSEPCRADGGNDACDSGGGCGGGWGWAGGCGGVAGGGGSGGGGGGGGVAGGRRRERRGPRGGGW